MKEIEMTNENFSYEFLLNYYQKVQEYIENLKAETGSSSKTHLFYDPKYHVKVGAPAEHAPCSHEDSEDQKTRERIIDYLDGVEDSEDVLLQIGELKTDIGHHYDQVKTLEKRVDETEKAILELDGELSALKKTTGVDPDLEKRMTSLEAAMERALQFWVSWARGAKVDVDLED
jgi:predicted RNase H-like nuclease (RuvC/YqgF family)